MSDSPIKGWESRVRQAALTVLLVAAGARIAWSLVAPVVPLLVSLIVVLTVLGVAVFGRHRK